jgi:ribulose-phosphate 3-epimerase
MTILAASLLGADPLRLADAIRDAEAAGIRRFHIDAMDGAFAPNIAFGPDTVSAVDARSDAFLDVHLMLAAPDRYLERYVTAGADALTIHLEAGLHHHRHLATVRDLGRRAGLAINPGTDLRTAETLLEFVDLVLVMSVDPGYGGQSLIRSTLRKVEAAAAWRDRHGLAYEISVDGGVNAATAADVAAAGADVLVVGTGLFRGDVAANVAALRAAAGVDRRRPEA